VQLFSLIAGKIVLLRFLIYKTGRLKYLLKTISIKFCNRMNPYPVFIFPAESVGSGTAF